MSRRTSKATCAVSLRALFRRGRTTRAVWWAFALAACGGPDTGPCSVAAAKTALADSLAWEISDRLGRAAQDLDILTAADSVALAAGDSAVVLNDAAAALRRTALEPAAREQRAALGALERRYETLPDDAAIEAYFRERDSVVAAHPLEARGALAVQSDSLFVLAELLKARSDSLFGVANSLRENWLTENRLAEAYMVRRSPDVERLRIEAAEAGILCEGP